MLKNRNKTVVAVLIAMLFSCCVFAEINIDWSKPQKLDIAYTECICTIGNDIIIISDNKYYIGKLNDNKLSLSKPKSNAILSSGSSLRHLKNLPNTNKVVLTFTQDKTIYYAIGNYDAKKQELKFDKKVATTFRGYDISALSIAGNGRVVMMGQIIRQSIPSKLTYNYGIIKGNSIQWHSKKPIEFEIEIGGETPALISISNDEFVMTADLSCSIYARYGKFDKKGNLIWDVPVFLRVNDESYDTIVYLEQFNCVYMAYAPDAIPRQFYIRNDDNLRNFKCSEKTSIGNLNGYFLDNLEWVSGQDKLFAIIGDSSTYKRFYIVGENIDIYDF